MNFKKTIAACVVAFGVTTYANADQCSFYVPELTGMTGTQITMPICIENPGVEITSFNGFIALPAGISIVNNSFGKPAFTLDNRVKDHTASAARPSNSVVSFICYSNTNMALTGNSGPVLNTTLQLDAAPGVYIIRFYDLNMTNMDLQSEDIVTTLDVKVTVTDFGKTEYGDNQLYADFCSIKQGENATLVMGYNMEYDIQNYSTEVILPEGVDVLSVEFLEAVTEPKNFTNTYSWDVSTRTLTLEGTCKKKYPEAGDHKFANIILDTSSLAPGEYSITVGSQEILTFDADDDDLELSPAATVATLKVNATGVATTLRLIDGDEYRGENAVSGIDVTYMRDFASTNWQALYLPYNMAYTDWSANASVAQLVDAVEQDGDVVLVWQTINSGNITPGHPYIIKPKSVGPITFSSEDCEVKAYTDKEDQTFNAAGNTYTLSGTYIAKADMATSGAYGLSSGEFRPTDSDAKQLKPFRIFLTISGSNPAKIRNIVDREEAGIDGILVDGDTDTQCFDMQGRKVNVPANGFYIINGKKTLVK